MKNTTFLGLSIVAVAIGTLIALAIAGYFAKKKYDESVASSPLLKYLG